MGTMEEEEDDSSVPSICLDHLVVLQTMFHIWTVTYMRSATIQQPSWESQGQQPGRLGKRGKRFLPAQASAATFTSSVCQYQGSEMLLASPWPKPHLWSLQWHTTTLSDIHYCTCRRHIYLFLKHNLLEIPYLFDRAVLHLQSQMHLIVGGLENTKEEIYGCSEK